jgi:cyanophycinase-like exopeptidase
MATKTNRTGLIALVGSGETTRYGGQVFERLASRYPGGSTIAILETPAGFELNSPAVAGRVAGYLRKRLKNHLPDIQVIPARAKGSELSPDNPQVIQPLASASLVFMGPGSPSYAVRQLAGSLAWKMICDRFWQGASLALASAAAIACGKLALPIYEIYKVGEDPHWKPGLDFFGGIGLALAIIPHYNNHDGGAELDTSCCFMGASRFRQLYDRLPKSVTVVGIDEMTTLVIDLAGECCDVMGMGQVHLLRDNSEKVYIAGKTFALTELGDYQASRIAALLSEAIDHKPVTQANGHADREIPVPPEVLELAAERQNTRAHGNWESADRLRKKIESLGWQITDTGEGFQLSKKQV